MAEPARPNDPPSPSSRASSGATTPPDVLALRDLAERAARAAADLVRGGRPDTVEVAATKSSAVDVVTQMDLAAERALRTLLARERPDDGVLGEEGGLEPGTSGVTWVLDPIDGTVNYLYGIPAYAVSVAAVAGPPEPGAWTLLAGCVHAVADGRTWTAARGHGAHLDGAALRVEDARPLSESLCGTGFGYLEARRRDQARVLLEVLPRVRDIRRIGSAAMDLCMVASGQLDLYYERGLNPWDLAAAQLVVQEAGGLVTGLRGRPAATAMTVAGPAGTVPELVALLEQLGADADGPPAPGSLD
ncbi:inositol-phosphate phosphatase [Actinotalea ferrariae CF5-4]|uniref:Inositol-1-monophosphatase n=1 Tax=Actinotalea ferrariae CF5-4 TaxID=948458 RepID=A0A021VRL8_9CELL|nr:inositol monophosphatase family protein [Actinotalea ferrariae]EYR63781.1 inositol-phosphate phosphatase [Actinotalea ferrariae CF5-4]